MAYAICSRSVAALLRGTVLTMAGVAALAGCKGPRQQSVEVDLIGTSSQCPVESTQLIQGYDPLAAFDNLSGGALPDARTTHLLVFVAGERPTAGYQLSLIATEARVQGDAAVVGIRELAPRPGTMVAQSLTHPCIALSVHFGSYRIIRVENEAGQPLVQLELPANPS